MTLDAGSNAGNPIVQKDEIAWLRYARRVLFEHGQGGLRTCCLGAGTELPPHERVLWPGYLGARYGEGRVLLVGAVHNASELNTEPIRALAEKAVEWQSDPLSDDLSREYLEAARSGYIKSATQKLSVTGKSWADGGVWGAFATLLETLKLAKGGKLKTYPAPWELVAFTNLAKCATPSGVGYTARVNHCNGSLLDRLPIRELKPLALFVSCGPASIAHEFERAGIDVPIVRVFEQRSRRSKFPIESKESDSWDSWRGRDAKRYLDLRANA